MLGIWQRFQRSFELNFELPCSTLSVPDLYFRVFRPEHLSVRFANICVKGLSKLKNLSFISHLNFKYMQFHSYKTTFKCIIIIVIIPVVKLLINFCSTNVYKVGRSDRIRFRTKNSFMFSFVNSFMRQIDFWKRSWYVGGRHY